MSLEHDHYAVRCKKCGRTGELVVSSDDWHRTEVSWTGFAAIKTSAFDPAASWCRCLKCGNDEHGGVEINRSHSN
jgi:predicted nucleic-acid-binding Zn-ribbon protein